MIKFTIPIAHEVLNKFNSSSIYFMKKIVADLKSKLNHRAGNWHINLNGMHYQELIEKTSSFEGRTLHTAFSMV